MSDKFDRWSFIEKWLPDYTHDEDVAYSNDLDCYINGETENSQYYKLKERFPDINDAIVEQEMVDSALFQVAYNNYAAHMKKELEYKRIQAQNERPKFVFNVTLKFEKSITVRADDFTEAKEIALREMQDSGINLSEHGFHRTEIIIE